MMKLNRNTLLAIVLLLLIAGCATTTAIYTDITSDVDFTQYKTYAWLPPVGDTTNGLSLFDNEIINEKIMAEVNEEMKIRGFEVDSENPDLLVNVHTSYEEKEEKALPPFYSTYDYYYPDFYYPGPWYPYYYNGYTGITRIRGYEMNTIRYTEGIIVVDIIEQKDSKLIWRGWVEDQINRYTLSDDIRGYIKNIFERFPIKPSSDNSGMVSSR